MAKVTKQEETKAVAAIEPEIDLYEGFSDEERAKLLGLTGQAANAGFDKTPILKTNRFPMDIQDPEAPQVRMGNFVLGQVTKKEGDNDVIVEIGTDLGANPDITVLKVGTKFNYMPKDRKKWCQSQLVLDVGERPRGDRLGYDCKDKSCPQRQESCKKDDKCSCQFVVFCEVTVAEEKIDALMYFKGESFIPFSEYLQSAGKYPSFFFPTKLNTERKTNGTNVYWVISPELQKDRPYAPEERVRLFKKVEKIDAQARDFEAQRKLLAQQRQEEQRKALPPGMSVEGPAGGGNAGGGIGGGATDAEFADIQF